MEAMPTQVCDAPDLAYPGVVAQRLRATGVNVGYRNEALSG